MPKGETFRKLQPEQVEYIRMRAARGVCQSALARKFKVSRQRVWQIATGYRRKQ